MVEDGGMIRWTPARDAQLREMYGDGASTDRMVAELQRTLRAIWTLRAIYQRASKLKLRRPRKRPRLQPRGRPQHTPVAELVPAFRRWLDEAGLPRLPMT